MVIEHELAVKYDGVISDEDESLGSWKGDTSKYQTYKTWLNGLFQKSSKQEREKAIEYHVNYVPEPLRMFNE